MSLRRVVIGAAVLVVVIAAAAAFVVWPRGTSPVTREEALDDFRSRASQPTSAGSSGAHTVAVEPGVYSYRTVGSEDVKLGVLPSEHRPYPDTVTVVVVKGEPGCFTTTLNLLDQHTEDTTYCIGDDGSVRLAGHRKHQKIGILSPVADMACDPSVILDSERRSSDLQCTLTLDGGPAKISATLTGTSTSKPGTAAVGGEQLDATLVTINHEISGDLSGTWREKLWLASDTRLPLRIERDLNIKGLATFTEQSDLALTDTRPAQ